MGMLMLPDIQASWAEFVTRLHMVGAAADVHFETRAFRHSGAANMFAEARLTGNDVDARHIMDKFQWKPAGAMGQSATHHRSYYCPQAQAAHAPHQVRSAAKPGTSGLRHIPTANQKKFDDDVVFGDILQLLTMSMVITAA